MKENIFILVIIILIKFVTCQYDVPGKFSKKFIVPDVIDTPPRFLLHIYFTSGKNFRNLGRSVPPRFLQTPPDVYIPRNIILPNNTFSTLIMVNADFPTRRNPEHRNFLHWLVVNVPATTTNFTIGDILASYVPVNPEKRSGQHRIVFLLYHHKDKISFKETIIKRNSTESMRYKFSVKNFEKKYKLGAPTFGNFFRCHSQ